MENLIDRIVIDPEVCHGKPTVRGLRYPVEMILELLASGMSHEEILEDYEDLQAEDILAVLQYATKLSKVKSIMDFSDFWNGKPKHKCSRERVYCPMDK
jgi:uncharacterized protein (DUF433 family)